MQHALEHSISLILTRETIHFFKDSTLIDNNLDAILDFVRLHEIQTNRTNRIQQWLQILDHLVDIIGENPIFSDFDLQAEDTPNCKEILWIDFLKVQTVVRETLKEIQEIIDELALTVELRG